MNHTMRPGDQGATGGYPHGRAANQITVLNLLNHTSGLDRGVIGDFGEGDDTLARYVSALAGLPLVTPPGARPSYSQAGFNLAGRIVEKVTGLNYEKAVGSLVFDPAGLSGSFFDRDDIMTRRFAVRHRPGPGAAAVRRGARPGDGRPLRERGDDVHRRDRRRRPADGPADGTEDGTEDGGPDQAGDPGGGGQGTAAGPGAVRGRPAPPRRVHRHGRRVRGPARLLIRDASGAITGVDLAQRLASRV